MNKRVVFWVAFAALALVMGIIQFIPTPSTQDPAEAIPPLVEEHGAINFEDRNPEAHSGPVVLANNTIQLQLTLLE